MKDDNIHKIIILIYIGYIINFLYAKELPLINVILGTGSYYKNIAMIPTIYPILTSINVFYIVYSYYHFLSFKDKKNLFYSIILFFPIIINMGRGILIMTLISCALQYYSHKKIIITKKNIIKATFVLIIILYVFGYIGNIRAQPKNMANIKSSERILILGNATEKFRDSIIPNEFFWTYIYIASPIANLNNLIKYQQGDNGSLFEFIAYNFFPQSLQENTVDVDQIDKKKYLVDDTFNVSTSYMIPYYQFGWMGIILYEIIFYVLFFLSFILLRKSAYKSIFLSLISAVSLLALFDNVFVLDVVAIPIFLCFIFTFLNKITKKRDISDEVDIKGNMTK